MRTAFTDLILSQSRGRKYWWISAFVLSLVTVVASFLVLRPKCDLMFYPSEVAKDYGLAWLCVLICRVDQESKTGSRRRSARLAWHEATGAISHTNGMSVAQFETERNATNPALSTYSPEKSVGHHRPRVGS